MTERRPFRQVSWIEAMTAGELSGLTTWDRRLWWVEPYLYLASLIGLPTSFVLAVVQPFGGPFVAYGLLVVLFGFGPVIMVGEECHAQGRSRHRAVGDAQPADPTGAKPKVCPM